MPPQHCVSYYLLGLLLLIGSSATLKCPGRGSSSPGRELVCYTRSHEVTRLENAICRCTTLVHQGHDLQSLDSSEIKSLRNVAKKANPSIRVVMSISDNHEILKSSKTTRQDAATHLTGILKEVDGVELNVTAGSKERLISFVKGLKDELVNKSIDKMILLSLPTKPEDLAKQFELKELAKYVDVFTVATHYLRDSEEAYHSFHPSRLMGLFDMLNTDSLVDLISGMGAPKQKILISAPASAYQFTLKKAEENTPRSPTIEEQPITLDRKKLCDAMNDGEWTVERDEDLTAPYAFKNTSWLAFEDETSLKIKGKYVMLRDLAGLGLRDVENDITNDCGVSVIQAVYKSFTEMKRKTREALLSSLESDLKDSKISYPRHVRSSDYRIVRVVDTQGKIRTVRENTRTAFTCTRQGYFVHPRSCNRFYRCVKFNQRIDDYSVFEFDCPAGLAFDERTEVCTWPGSLPRSSACPGSSEIEPVPRERFRCPSHPGFYADPRNCRWFLACYDLGGPEMVPYEFRCPFGLVFDEHKLVCEWPWKVPNCNGHGHGDDHGEGHGIYKYGGIYGGQDGDIPQGGIVGVGGFVGQGGLTEGTYDTQSGQGIGFGAGAYNGQNYNTAGTPGTYDGQAFNGAGTFGTQGSYNGQAQSGAAAGYSGQSYNADYDGQNYDGAGVGRDEQTYNAGNFGSVNIGYNGQTYNSEGVSGAGVGYNGQSYNVGGAGFDEQTYNSGGVSSQGASYNGQSYNSGVGAANADYDGQTYNAGGSDYDQQNYNAGGNAGVSSPRPFAPSIYNQPNYHVQGSGVDYDEHHYNGHGGGIDYNNQAYDSGSQAHIDNGKDYDSKNYDGDTQAHVDTGKDYDSQNYGGDTQAHVDTGKDYDSQNYGGDTQAHVGTGKNCNNQNHGGDTQAHVDIGKDYNNQNYDGDTQSHVGVGRPVTLRPTGYDGQSVVTSTVNYNDRGAFTSTNNYAGQGSTYANADSKATQFNVGTAGTTIGVNNFAGDTLTPTGFTSGTATNYAGGIGSTTGYTAGVTTGFAKNGYTGGSTTGYAAGTTTGYESGNTAGYAADVSTTGYGSGSTTGYALGNTAGYAAGGSTAGYAPGSTTNYAGGNTGGYATGGSTTGYNIGTSGITNGINNFAGQTGTIYGGSTNGYVQNTYGSTGPYYGGVGSTANVQTNTFGSDVSQYTGGRGPTVYNATYNPNLGYPSSTILPFRGKENTDDYQGSKPINSIIYNSNLAVGLSTSESFGTQYTNQAGKGFTSQGQGPTQYGSYDQTQSTPNYNTVTNFYDNSKLAEGTKTTAGLGKFGGSTIAPDYSTGAGRNNDNNSPLIGSSLVPNNEITKYNENTGTYFGSTFYNKGTTLNQNPYASTGFAQTSGSNAVTPSTIIPGYNKQSTPIPGVVPLADSRPVVELENSALYTPGAKVSTTLYPGYRTNDVQDYRTPSYTGIPNSFIINAGNGENEQSTILKAGEQTTTEVYTRGGFTKTGATKTGITTAQVGGSGSYVIGTGTPRQRPNPQYIGEHAFSTNLGSAGTATNFGTAATATNFGTAGISNNGGTTATATNFGSVGTATNFGTAGTTTNYGTAGTATNFGANQNTNFETSGAKGNTASFGITGLSGGVTTADYGQSNTATGTNTNFIGYSYPKPSIPFETGFPSSTPSVTQTPFYLSTTPSSVENQNSVLIGGTKTGYSSTISPVAYTTSQADNFRTTIYQAARVPQKVSTVRPVIDTGSRTIISTTAVPVVVTTQRPIYENNVVSTTPQSYLGVGVSFDQGNYDDASYAQGSTGNSDYSDITSNFEQGIFGQKLGGQTRFTNNYPQPSTNSPLIKQNNEFIKSTEENYDAFTQTGTEFTAQTKSVRINPGSNYRPRINIPSQVYLPSTTISPVVGVTFGRPIVAAEFNKNSDFVYRGSNNRFLNKQASSTVAPQRSTNGVLINQVSSGYDSQGYNNGQILRNQASSGVTPQGAAETYFNNQAAGTFSARGNIKFSSGQTTENSFIAQNQDFSRESTSSVNQNKEVNGKTRTLVGSQVVTSFGNSGFNSDVARQNSANQGNLKVETEFNSGSKKYQSTTLAPEITTYTGDYGRTRLQSSTRNQNKKVIVKLSDLRPLILGKLGAECTCRADPFAVFRGPTRQSLPINSQNRGAVDLANYDESEIYVDLDTDKENQSEIDFAKNIPSNRLLKTPNLRFNGEYDGGVVLNSRGESTSSTYLPPTARPSSTYLPAKPSIGYLPPSTPAPFSSVLSQNQASLNTRTQNRQPLLIRVEDNYANSRAGKALFDGSVNSANKLKNQGASFDRYGPGGLRDSDETLQGEFDCARPGLFRHPKHCNKFYACHWDDWKKKYTLHVFNCPVHLAFDSSVGACNYPSKGPACQDNRLLI